MTIKSNIIILGSCVSRDPFSRGDAKGNDFSVLDYYARSSLASLSGRPSHVNFDLSQIASDFQRRMVDRDISKVFFNDIVSADFDIILLDFIDDRFEIIEIEEGLFVTNSSEFSSARLNLQPIFTIEPFSDSFFERQIAGWEKFFALMCSLGSTKKILINKVYWSAKDDSGFELEDLAHVQKANTWLDRVYQRLQEDLPEEQFISYERNRLIAKSTHKWGLAPFHYVDEVEIFFLEELDRYVEQFCIAGPFASSQPIKLDYSRWGLGVVDCQTIEMAVEQSLLKDGIYRIVLGAASIDLLILRARDIRNSKTLVSFSGAVTDRGSKCGPFFSGLTIANDLGLPLIAIADPTVSYNSTLGLGWYAGSHLIPDLPDIIAEYLDRLVVKSNCKLTLFGGSGGGFATINILSRLKCGASGLAFNPQTSIGEYSPSAVLDYLEAAFPECYQSVVLSEVGTGRARINAIIEQCDIDHDVTLASIAPNKALFYLQNETDWHVQRHLLPFLQADFWTRFSHKAFKNNDRRVVVCLGDWSVGHATLPRDLIVKVISLIARQYEMDSVTRYIDRYSKSGKRFLSSFSVDGAAEEFDLSVSLGKDTVSCFITVDQKLEIDQFAFYLLKNGERINMRWYESNPTAIFEGYTESESFAAVGFVKDHFGSVITKRIDF